MRIPEEIPGRVQFGGETVERRDIARYPFVKAAREAIQEWGVTPEEIASEVLYAGVRRRGVERLKCAIEGVEIPPAPLRREEEIMAELLSYVYSRMIVSAIAEPYLLQWHAHAESDLTYRYLMADSTKEGERPSRWRVVVEVAEELNLEISVNEESFVANLGRPQEVWMHFTSFLRHSTRLSGKEWRLINREVKRGWVRLRWEEFLRLLREGARERYSSTLTAILTPKIVDVMEDDIREVEALARERRERYKPKPLKVVELECFPPCMKRILAMIQGGENPPHHARFALTTFLHSLGMGEEEIVRTFSSTPDFDESMARYQVRHILGITSGTEYSTPECSTMKSYNICYDPDALCNKEWMKHPLTYYRVKCKNLGKTKEG
ncbi:MAG: DNA primase large subunit PriL [Thermoplasmata archaeon]|nr:DNA primase large subunit PriL [Thermoplasmata archaeon]